eukprot:5155029-Pleurochrysis_carterae.AAC.2
MNSYSLVYTVYVMHTSQFIQYRMRTSCERLRHTKVRYGGDVQQHLRRLAEGVHRHVERQSGRAGPASTCIVGEIVDFLFHYGIGAAIALHDMHIVYYLAQSCEALWRRRWRLPLQARSKNAVSAPLENIPTNEFRLNILRICALGSL